MIIPMDQRITLKHNQILDIRHTLLPGDQGRMISFHGEVYSREHQLGKKFEGYVAETIGAFARCWDEEQSHQRVWLASPPGSLELAACCAVLHYSDEEAQFRWFLVDPAYRGSGLGRYLLEDARTFAHEAGYQRMFLLTSDFLPPAAALYRSIGMKLVEETPYDGWEVPFHEQRYELDLHC